MEEESSFIPTVECMMDNGMRVQLMVMEHCIILIRKSLIKEVGSMRNSMDKVS